MCIRDRANAPITIEGDRILEEKGVLVVPDILANAGGVTVSYFEWVQDLQSFFWEEDEINNRLERVMFRSFDAVMDTARRDKIDMRRASYLLAVERIANAISTRGLYP